MQQGPKLLNQSRREIERDMPPTSFTLIIIEKEQTLLSNPSIHLFIKKNEHLSSLFQSLMLLLTRNKKYNIYIKIQEHSKFLYFLNLNNFSSCPSSIGLLYSVFFQ